MSTRLILAFVTLFFHLYGYAQDSSVFIKKKGGGEALIYNQSVALLIFASKYNDKYWPELKNIPADVRNVRAALEQQGFKVEVESDVTSTRIIPKIQGFLSQKFGRDSRAIVYYSGHGYTESTGHAFLVGTDVPRPDQSEKFNSRLVSILSLREVIKASKANHTLLVLDSCYSGAVLQTKSSLPPPSTLLVTKLKQRAVWLLASGTEKQRVSADQVFAQIFVNGLQGDAAKDPERRYLTMSELAWWVEQNVPSFSNQTPVSGPISAEGGDILFVPSKASVVTSVRTVPSAALAAASAEIVRDTRQQFAGRFPGLQVFYYRKAGDELSVIKALNAARIQYTAKPPILSDRLRTNSIFCGQDTPIEAVKEIAYALMDQGIDVQLIHTFYRKEKQKSMRIEIVSIVDAVTLQPLNLKTMTRQQIAALERCPTSPPAA